MRVAVVSWPAMRKVLIWWTVERTRLGVGVTEVKAKDTMDL